MCEVEIAAVSLSLILCYLFHFLKKIHNQYRTHSFIETYKNKPKNKSIKKNRFGCLYRLIFFFYVGVLFCFKRLKWSFIVCVCVDFVCVPFESTFSTFVLIRSVSILFSSLYFFFFCFCHMTHIFAFWLKHRF